MNKKEILIICFIICSILSLHAVAASSDLNSSDDVILTAHDSDVVVGTSDVSAYSLPDSDNKLDGESGEVISAADSLSDSDNLQVGSGNAGTFSDLQNNISGKQSVTLVNNFTYNDSVDSGLANGIDISSPITIDGQGKVVIDANKQARVFNIAEGVAVTLKGITFINGNIDGEGGSIHSHGILTLIDCSFINNTASGHGGAIYMDHSTQSTIENCDFTGNVAGLNGGAIDWHAGSTHGKVIKSTFTNNTAKRSGGAIHWSGHYGTISDSNFTNNRATGDVIDEINGVTGGGDGGAVLWVGSHGIIKDNCNFINNFAQYRGGAIFVHGNSTENCTNTTVTNSNFEDNIAGLNGGAIDWQSGTINGMLSYSTFINNTALRSGGAVYWYGTNGTVSHCEFTNNHALGTVDEHSQGIVVYPTFGGNGGAILWTGSIGKVEYTNFTNNDALHNGGAVYLQSTDSINCTNTSFTKCIFDSNYAGLNGGAIDWHEGANEGKIYNSTFRYNEADSNGGAVFWSGHNGEIYYSNFTNNTAKGLVTDSYGNVGDGGAIIWSGDNGTVSHCRFANNSADKRGGAVYLQNCTHTNCTNTSFEYVYFINNTAGTNGGAIDWHEGAQDGRVHYAVFEQNTAKRSGGAIYWNGHSGEIKHSNFTNNKALGINNASDAFGNITYGGDGGAVIWIGSDGEVDNCTFIDNEAAKRGGAVYLQASSAGDCKNTNFTNSHFENNTAGTNGGAVDWNKGAHNGLVENVTFVNNTAGRSGGAIYWNGNDGTIRNSNFTNNKALGVNNASDAFGNITYGGDGGAVIWIGSDGKVDNCRFIDNEAVKRGGAVYLQANSDGYCNNTKFINSLFENNTAGTNGGAIDWNKGAHNGIVDNVTFINNTAKRSGGAIFWNGHNGTIQYSTFNDNHALGIANDTNVFGEVTYGGDGGALMWSGAMGNVISSNFTNNDAADHGGAVYLQGSESESSKNTYFDHVNFINNTAGVDGGAIAFEVGVTGAFVDHSKFINNTAERNGGAINFLAGSSGENIYNSTFDNNVANCSGGALYWEGNDGTVKYCNFTNNKALGLGDRTHYIEVTNNNTGVVEKRYNITGGEGGAIMLKGSHNTIENSKFYQNTAEYSGGAIYLMCMSSENCTNNTFKYCNFTENLAKLNGGAVNWAEGASNATVIGSFFINNTAYRSAGAIYVNGNYLDIKDSEFWYNKATQDQTYDNRTSAGLFSSEGGNAGAICWMGSYGDVMNATFINNTAKVRGGAIQFERNKNATVKNSRFENNTAGTEGGAIDMYKEAVNAKIIDSNFTTNYAQENGGAIYWEGHNGLINGSRFEGNEALGAGDRNHFTIVHNSNTGVNEKRYNITGGDGGAIMLKGSHTTIENTTFYQNTAEYSGGAIYLIGVGSENCTNITFKDCNFTDNLAKLNGGAVNWARGASNATVTGSFFINNTAYRSAGAIYVSGNYLDIKDSEFWYNEATQDQTYDNRTSAGLFSSEGGNAGAICWMGSYGDVMNATFINNTAKVRGGAIQFEGSLNATVKDSRFENNSAGTDGGAIDWYEGASYGMINNTEFTNNHAQENGGSIYIQGDDNVISHSRFYDSFAGINGGTIYVKGEDVNITDSIFKNSKLDSSRGENGGAINIAGSNTDIINCTFEDTHAPMNGGAIYVYGENADIEGSRFNDSSASLHGGAIYIEKRNASIRNSNFTTSTVDASGSQGGAIYVDGENALIEGSIFTDSSADKQGGAIYIKKKNAVIRDSNFTTSTVDASGSQGGAIYVDGENTLIEGSSFTDSYAKLNGGTIYIKGEKTTIKGSNFTGSTVDAGGSQGGAIYLAGSKCIVNGSLFNDCSAAQDGGAMYSTGSDSGVYNSNFTNNNAQYDGGGIYWKGAVNNTVDGCIFTGNIAYAKGAQSSTRTTFGGGALYWSEGGSYGTLKNSKFYNNSVQSAQKADGGAVLWDKSAHGVIDNCIFECNYVTTTGGNVWVQGGALFLRARTNFTLSNCEFKNSSSSKEAGAIYLAKVAWGSTVDIPIQILIVNTTFTNNKAEAIGENVYGGGAIQVKDPDSYNITFRNLTFTNNTANQGGAVSVYKTKAGIKFEECRFIGNEADNGGAVYYESGQTGHTLVISDSNFTLNKATSGSAIYTISTDLSLTNVMLLKNRADSYTPFTVYKTNTELYFDFYGWDNLLNGIYSTKSITFTNVTYWKESGVANTGPDPISRSKAAAQTLESGQNFTIKLFDKNGNQLNVGSDTYLTNANGHISVPITSEVFSYDVYLTNEDYYTYVEASTRVKPTIIGFAENITYRSNATINVTIDPATNKNISVYINGTFIGNITTDEGEGSIDISTFINGTYLEVGQHEVLFVFGGDARSKPANATTILNITKITPIIKLDTDNIGNALEINVTVIDEEHNITDATGIVTVSAGGYSVNVHLENGKGFATISNLHVAEYNVTAHYYGDNHYFDTTNSTLGNVTYKPQAQINITVEVKELYWINETVHISVSVQPNATGNITLYLNGVPHVLELNNSEATYEAVDLKEGTNFVLVTYEGSKTLAPNWADATFEVIKYNTPVAIEVVNITVEESELINITLCNDTEGLLNVIINGSSKYYEIINGTVSVPVSNLAVGVYNVTAIFGGDKKYYGASNSTLFYVTKSNPTLIIDTPEPVDANTNATIVVRICETATGNITITVNGTKYNATIVNGVATFIIDKLPSGKYDITAEYAGDGNHSAAENVTLVKGLIVTQVTCYQINVIAKDTKVDLNTTIIVKVPVDATGNVSIYIDGELFKNVTVDHGIAKLNVTKPYGNHTVNVTFSDGKYGFRYATTDYWVFKHESPITIDVDDIKVGDKTIINVTAPNDVLEDVYIEIDGVKYTEHTIVNGKAVFEVQILSNGTRTVVASYDGGDKYVFNYTTGNFTVTKRNSWIKVDVTNSTVGSGAFINVTVPANATGYVIVNVDNVNYNINLTDGKGNITVYNLENKTYNVNVTYVGDDQYLSSTNGTKLGVDKSNTTLGISVENIDYGDVANIVVTVAPGDATGFITIRIKDGDSITLPVVGGNVEWNVSGLAAGTYTVYANYSGDGKYNVNNTEKVNKSFTVNQITPAITVIKVISEAGKNATVIVRIDSRTTENITVTVNNKPYSVKPGADGVAVVVTDVLENGTYVSSVSYPGDTNFTDASVPFTFATNKTYDYLINLTAGDIEVDDLTNIIVNVPVDAKGIVIVDIAGTNYTATIKDGRAVFNNETNLPEGRYNITAYFGNDKYENKTATGVFYISKHATPIAIGDIAPIKVGDKVVIAVTAPSDVLDDVYIEIDGVKYTEHTIVDDKAVFEVQILSNGTRTVVATYDGGDKYEFNSTTGKFDVTKRNSHVNVSVENITVGGIADIVVKVPANATGYVVVVVNGTNYTANLTGGVGHVYLKGLGNGTYNINVTYIGDDQYLSSTNSTKLGVDKSNTTLSIVVGSIDYGDVANIVVSVRPVDATGFITVRIEGGKSVTLPVVDGSVEWNVSGLAAGTYTVYANYSGDGKYNINNTEKVNETFTVNQITPAITVIKVISEAGKNATVIVRIDSRTTENVTVTVNNKPYSVKPDADGIAVITTDVLENGTYVSSVSYPGDRNFTDANVPFTFTANKTSDYLINLTAGDIEVDDLTNIIVNVPADAKGIVKVEINGVNYTASIKDGKAVFYNETGLPVGKYNVTAYFGNDKYANMTAVGDFYIGRHATPMSIEEIAPIKVGDKAVIKVTAPDDVLDDVYIEIGGVKYTEHTVVDGKAVFEVQILSNGTKTVVATYDQGVKYKFNSTTGKVTVTKRNSYVNVSVENITVGGVADIVVKVPVNATGYVVVVVNGTNYTANLTGGVGHVYLKGLGNGTYNINVTYIGDDQYLSSTNSTKLGVDKSNTTLSIVVGSIDYGDVANIVVTVAPSDATGFITVRIKDGDSITLPVVGGKVEWNVSGLAAGTYTVYANYSGDGKYNINNSEKVNRSFTVNQITPAITVIKVISEAGKNATVIVRIDSRTTENITVTVNNKPYSVKPGADGVAVVVTDVLENGTYASSVSYPGDRNFTDATVPFTFTSNKTSDYIMNVTASDVGVGENTTIVVNVPKDAAGTVTVWVNGTKLTNTTHDGKAIFYINQTKEGRYAVNATLSDAKYANQTVETNYYVSRVNIPITIDVDDIEVGDIAIITVTVPDDVTRNVTIEIDGVKYNKTVDEDGKAVFEVQIMSNGTRTVVATYYGDDKYVFNSTTENFTVTKRSSYINVDVANSTVGSGAFINVTVPANATGYVIVNVDNTNYTINLTDGKGNVTVYNLMNKTYEVTVTYIGDDQYLSSTNSTKLAIDKIITTFEVNGTDITVGEGEFIKFETPDNITGLVKVEINDKNYTAFIYEGKGNLTVYGLEAGDYNVTVYFEGNYKYLPAASPKNNFTVKQTTAEIVIVPQNITHGDAETIIIYINSTGTVNVTVDTYEENDVPIVGGKVTIEVPGYLSAGNYTVYVDYNGNVNHTSSSAQENFEVAKADPIMTVEVQNITYGDVEHIKVTVNAEGNITIKVNGKERTIVLENGVEVTEVLRAIFAEIVGFDGKATLDVHNLEVGEYPVEVTFNGNENYNKATINTKFFVTKDNVTVSVDVENIRTDGKEVINVTFSNVNVTGNVTINVDGINYTREIKDGKANLTLDKLSNATHSVVVIYEGDRNFNGNWTSDTFNVTKVKPGISLDVSNTTVGQTERIVVHLPDNATGYVVIDVDGTRYHVDIIEGQEIALEIDNLENKTYDVEVYYSGDGYWQDATASDCFNVSKVKANITVKVENITLGEVAVINITVTPGAMGNVTITVGDEFNKTVGITGGVISVDVPGLTVGNKTVEVTYNGDGRYLPNGNSTIFSVGKLNFTSNIQIVDNGNGTVTVIMPQNATGNVTVYVDGKNFTANVTDGIAIINLNNVTPGKHNITAVYSGDGNYTGATVNSTVVIPKLAAPISVDVHNILVGDVAYINVTAPTGDVTIEINGKAYEPASFENGVARFVVENLAYGNKTVAVTYAGNSNYTENFTTANFTVTKRGSYVKVNVSDIYVGDVEYINVTVPDNATGLVVVSVGGVNYTVNVTDGVATVPVAKLGNGTYPVVATYIGDEQYSTSVNDTQTFTVSKVQSAINITVSHGGIIANGTDVNITIHAPADATGKVNITVHDDIKNITYIIYVNDGVGVLHLETPEIGIYNITAKYLGDYKYLGSENETEFEVYLTGKSLSVETEPVTVAEHEDIEVWASGNHVGDEVTIRVMDSEGNVVAEENVTFDEYHNTDVNMTSAKLQLGLLPAGDYTVEAFYLEINGTKIVEHNGTGKFTVSKLPSSITIREIENITVGGIVTIELELDPQAATGNISVFVNGVEYKTNSSELKVTVTDLPAEEYIVHAVYFGDHDYYESNATSIFKVSRNSAPISINVTNSKVGEIEQINVTLPKDATGRVLLDIGDSHYYANITNGTATFNIAKLNAGNYNVTATYEGDDRYLANTTNSSFEVSKWDSFVNVTVHDIAVGDNEVITFTTPADATGNITVTVGGATYTVAVSGGKGTLTIAKLTNGTYDVKATYNGDSKYLTSDNNTVEFTVRFNSTEIEVEDLGNGSVKVTLPENATGNVTVKVGGKEFNATLVNGTAIVDLENVTPGTHEIEVIYPGDENYPAATQRDNVTVPKHSTPFDTSAIPTVKVGDNATITIGMPEGATGNVTIEIDGVKYTSEIKDGNATFKVDNLTAGVKTIAIDYGGDNNFTANHTTANFTVEKITPTITVNATDINVGDKVLIEVTAPKDVTKPVLVDVGGVGYYVNITDGKGQLYVPIFASGNYNVTARYPGDDKYTDAQNETSFEASKVSSTVNVTAEDITYGDKAVINVETPEDLCGNVTVSVDGENYTVYVSGGHGTLVVPGLDVGPHTVEVTFAGCNKYEPSNNTAEFNVNKVKLNESDIKIIDQGNGTVVVVVPENATGNVTIKVGDNEFNATVINGTAIVQLENVTPGTHEIEVIYSGDGNYTNATVNATVVIPRLVASLEVNVTDIYVGDVARINVTVPKGATGKVFVEINGKLYNATIDNGVARFEIENLTFGNKTVAVTYRGDDNYTEAFTTANFTVFKRDSQVNVTVNATVVGKDTVINVTIPTDATGYVIVDVDGVSYNVNTTGGVGSIIVKGLGNSTHTVNVTYVGDGKYLSSTNGTTFGLDRVSGNMTVKFDNITVGDVAIINITVPSDATGNITVSVNGTDVTVGIVNGTAQAVIPGLGVGNYTIDVTYNGDDKYSPMSDSTSLEVAKADLGQDIKVIDQGNGTVVVVVPGNATGNVTITVENKTFNGTVINGTAVITLENVTPGTHEVEVIYSGDGNYTNATVNATVVIPRLVTSLEVNVTDIYVGDVARINVTVPKGATGKVFVEINGKLYNATIDNGVARFEIENLTFGNKTVAVTYRGDDNYTEAFTTDNFTVFKRDSQVNVTVNATVVGKDTIINVTIPTDATGYVIVDVDGVSYNVNTTGGVGSVVVKGLGNATHTVNVTYIGDGKYLSSTNGTTFGLDKVSGNMTVKFDNITVGDVAIINITVPSDATGNITVSVNGTDVTVGIVNGTAQAVIPGLGVGNYTIEVTYNGDDKYSPMSDSTSLEVAKADVTSGIKVIDQGNGTVVVVVPGNATGNVTITVDNKTFNGTVVNGTAVITLENVTPGLQNVTVVYSGDGNYANATVNATVVIPRLVASLEVNVTDIYVGDVARINVTVPKGATGKVFVEINGKLYNATIDNGVARFEIENLTFGNKTVAVTYRGDDNYTEAFTTANFTVSKNNSTVKATLEDIDVGENATITVYVPEDATGQVLVDINGQGYYVNVTDGTGVLTVPGLTNGTYDINLTYLGDGKYLTSANTTSIKVSKVKPFVIPYAYDIYVGEIEAITLSVPADATGTVTVVVDGEEYVFTLNQGTIGAQYVPGKKYHVAIANGTGELVLSGLPKGEYIVSVKYNGDDKYSQVSNVTSFKVLKKGTDMSIFDQGNGTVVVVLPDDATGNVTVNVGGKTFVSNVTDGIAVINMDGVPPGEYEITATYSGDGNYNSTTENATVVIPKRAIPISVTVQDIYVGDTEVVTVTVPKGATGKIAIEIDAKEYTAPIKNGKATFHVTGLRYGDKTVAVTYVGDDNYGDNFTTGQFTVKKRPTTVKATSSNINVGTDEIIIASVLPKDATGRVLVDINGVGYYGTIINGKAKVVVPELFAGKYAAKVTYEGDDKYLPSKTTTSFTVTKVKTPIRADGDEIWQGENATVIVKVPKDATGTVTINVKGTEYTAEVEDGKAVFSVPNLSKGDYGVTAKYSGNKKYEANGTITDIEVHHKDHGKNNTNQTKNGSVKQNAVKGAVNLADYPTGNPILILLVVLLAIGLTQIRRFKK